MMCLCPLACLQPPWTVLGNTVLPAAQSPPEGTWQSFRKARGKGLIERKGKFLYESSWPLLSACLLCWKGSWRIWVSPFASEQSQRTKFHPRMSSLGHSCLPGARFWEELFLLWCAVPFQTVTNDLYLSLIKATPCLCYFYSILTTSQSPWFCCGKS